MRISTCSQQTADCNLARLLPRSGQHRLLSGLFEWTETSSAQCRPVQSGEREREREREKRSGRDFTGWKHCQYSQSQLVFKPGQWPPALAPALNYTDQHTSLLITTRSWRAGDHPSTAWFCPFLVFLLLWNCSALYNYSPLLGKYHPLISGENCKRKSAVVCYLRLAWKVRLLLWWLMVGA